MPVGIIPDISEQMCIGCALCVEICTTLGPDVLRVKPVEGWKRGKAFVFYPERCISDGACIGVCPTKAIFWMRPMDFLRWSMHRCLPNKGNLLDETNGLHCWTTSSTLQELSLRQRLDRINRLD